MPRSEGAPRAAGGLGALLLASLVLALAAPALAGSVYRWETPEGGLAFTDDPDRVPARHRDAAERVEMEGLATYSRFTPKREEGETDPAERLARHAERLRSLGAAAHREAASRKAAAPGSRGAVLEMGHGMKLRVPAAAAGDGSEPLVVEEVRVREPGGTATKTDTVVRKGDRVFVVVSPLGEVRSRPGHVRSEAELLRPEGDEDEE